jgi:putative hydrolase of the HAD superfamily
LDDTILDRAGSIRKYCSLLQEDFRDALGASTLERIHAAVIDADDFGSLQQAETLALSSIWRVPPAPNTLAEHWARRFGDAAVPFPDAIELLRALSQRGVKSGVVTNGGSDMQRRKIAALGLQPLIGSIVISSEVALRKPDAAIFALALEQLGCTPEHSWFVGDHPDIDVRGAEAAGLRAFWVKTGAILADDVPGTHLTSLVDLLAHLD